METVVKKDSQILSEAADLLEKSDRWNKGRLFKANESNPEKGCSMCAHGAIMYCSSDKVKLRADENNCDAFDAGPAVHRRAALAAGEAAAYYQKLASQEGLSIPEYLRKHYGESTVAHYKANMAGLRYEYNDAPNTTKQDVVDKLREATKL